MHLELDMLLAFELLLAPQVVNQQAYLHHQLDLDLLLGDLLRGLLSLLLPPLPPPLLLGSGKLNQQLLLDI